MDPTFADLQIATVGDFHLRAGSSVADQGTASGAPFDDFDGGERSQGAGVDMGAHDVE